jgi:hypothetical protein
MHCSERIVVTHATNPSRGPCRAFGGRRALRSPGPRGERAGKHGKYAAANAARVRSREGAQRCSRPARGNRAGKPSVFCELGGLAEQVVQFGLDVDMVTLIARRHNLIGAAEEVRDLLDGSLKVRLAER